jgi:hypothetical protein
VAAIEEFPGKRIVKIRAQKTRLWFNPWKGTLCDRAAINLQLERWSVGVLENRTHDKHLPGIKPEIDGILFLWRPRALDHYSNTPPLPGFFKAEPSVWDLTQLPARRPTARREDQGFHVKIKMLML